MYGLRNAVIFLFAVSSVACAYPRRSTSLVRVDAEAASDQAPSNLWTVRVLSAYVPERQRSGLPWDGDGSGPDVFVRLYRNETELWQSRTFSNTRRPKIDSELKDSFYLPPNALIRFELWDNDGLSADPIGIWRNPGLPESATPGAEITIVLEGQATIAFAIERPHAYRGLGILDYEHRGDELFVREVVSDSPAGRAGVQRGDRIIKIAAAPVASLDEGETINRSVTAGARRALR